MLTLCCTTKLLKRLREQDAPASPSPEPRLGDWYATVLQLRPHHVVLLVNDPTRLAAVIPARDLGRLGQASADAIARVLKDLGVDAAVVEEERRAMADVSFTKTVSRSVRGTMSELGYELELLHNSSPHLSEHALGMRLNGGLVTIPGFGCRPPAEVAVEVLARPDGERRGGA